jgi:aminoglycoside 6'-N-acetyltransferase
MSTLPDHLTRIDTERLFLRPYQAGDGAWYFAMSRRNCDHLRRFEAGNPLHDLQTEHDAEGFVRSMADAWTAGEHRFLGAFVRDTGQFAAQIYIGCVSLILPEYRIGYFADVGHEGHGYVTEAVRACITFIFEQLHAHRISLECDDTNLRSQRVAERSCMPQEAHFRENRRWPDNTLTGTLHYGLLRHEWTASSDGTT